MTMPELTTAAEVMANARRVQARIAASRPMGRPKPIMAKVEAPAPVIVPPPVPKKTKAIKEAVPPQPEPTYPEIAVLHSVSKIVRTVAWFYNISPVDILSIRRTADVVLPRQVAAYLAKTLTTFSLPEIGRRMAGKDQTTILHSVRKITALRVVDPKLDADLTALEAKLMPAVSAMKQRNMEVAA